MKSIYTTCFLLVAILQANAQIVLPGGPDSYIAWVVQVSGTASQLKGVYMASTNIGWAVGASGTIVKTVNGTTWSALTSGTAQTLNNCHFTSVTTGWAVGTSGTIIKTIDGGNNWLPQTSGTTTALYGVSFVNNNVGWCSGGSGTVLKTVNGGVNWTAQTTGTTNSLYDIKFKNVDTGFATGNNGVIIKTINGGATWTAQASGTTVGLNSIGSTNFSKVYAVGDGGKIAATLNGGTTWNSQTSGTANSLSHVSFVNDSTGWAIGDGGTVITTSNNGVTWTEQIAGSASNLNGNFMLDTLNGWAVGNNGTILKYVPYSTLLPLTLTQYSLHSEGNNVTNTWQTQHEVNTAYFIIQRSENGRVFNDIGKVSAAGNSSTQSYSYTDIGALNTNASQLYYRLQMQDADGKVSYSRTISLPVKSVNNAAVKLYPNPAKDNLTVQMYRATASQETIQLTDISGKILQQKQVQLNPGINYISLPVSTLAKGNYLVVITGQNTFPQKFIKE